MDALRDAAAGRAIGEPKKADSAIQPPENVDVRRWQATSEEVRSARDRFEAAVDEIRAAGVQEFMATPTRMTCARSPSGSPSCTSQPGRTVGWRWRSDPHSLRLRWRSRR